MMVAQFMKVYSRLLFGLILNRALNFCNLTRPVEKGARLVFLIPTKRREINASSLPYSSRRLNRFWSTLY